MKLEIQINKIFFEFSNKGRYQVFRLLHDKKLRHSEIETELPSIPGSEISRHLKRLLKNNLIVKDKNNQYSISNIGRIFYKIMDVFEVSIKNESFFNSHDISSIPIHLLLQLGELKTLEISYKTMLNIELWSDLVKNSNEFVWAISDQFQNSLLPIVEKKLQSKSIEIRALINKGLLKSYRIPGEWADIFEDSEKFYKSLKIYKNIRILDPFEFSLIVSEKGAILFLKKEGEIDYSQCLIDNQQSFIQWTKSLFEKYWKKGKELEPFITQEMRNV